MSLNDTIAELPRLFGSLKPVGRALSDPEVNLGRFIRGLYRMARYTAPAAREQAQFFAFAATAFRAISSNPEGLKEAISEAPLTYETGIRLLPQQRVFLANVEQFARLMRPGAEDLRVTLPVLNEALETGAPVLRDSPPVNRRLREALRELNQLVTQPSTRVTLERLGETFRTARPLVRWVAPAQTVCNLFNYWFTNFPGALSEPSQVGYSLRQAIVRFPGAPTAEVGIGGYTGIGPNGKTGTGEFSPYEIPITNSHPYGPTGQHNADCQPGQIGYPLGQLLVPGQRLSDPANRVSDLPGSRGPLTAFWNADGRADPLRQPRRLAPARDLEGGGQVRGMGTSRWLPSWLLGLLLLAVVAVGSVLAYTKELPWSDRYEVHAVFSSAQTIRTSSPVRIAGVNVGEVTGVELTGEPVEDEAGSLRPAVRVTMELEENALPLKEDAFLKVRPRLFIDGNYFVDLHPGSPSAARSRRRPHLRPRPDRPLRPARRGADHAAERRPHATCRRSSTSSETR